VVHATGIQPATSVVNPATAPNAESTDRSPKVDRRPEGGRTTAAPEIPSPTAIECHAATGATSATARVPSAALDRVAPGETVARPDRRHATAAQVVSTGTELLETMVIPRIRRRDPPVRTRLVADRRIARRGREPTLDTTRTRAIVDRVCRPETAHPVGPVRNVPGI